MNHCFFKVELSAVFVFPPLLTGTSSPSKTQAKRYNDRLKRRLTQPGDSTTAYIEQRPGATSMFPTEVQQLLVVKEEVPSEWRPGMDQQVPEPIHMKQEQEELFTGQEGKQLNAQDDADVSRFQFTAVTMKSEIEEEDPPSSQLHQSQTEDKVTEPLPSSSTTQIKTETVGKDCGGTNAARNLGMSSHLLPNTNEKSSDSSEHENSYDWQEPLSDTGPETEDNDGSEEMLAINSGINAVKYVDTTVGKIVCKAGKKSLICFYCSKDFYKKVNYDTHMRIHTGEKPFACELCGKRFNHQGHFKIHMRVHTGEKPFACELCGKRFTHQGHLKRHMRVHTGEKPFSCELCGKRLTEQAGLNKHMKVHTGEKPFSCELCGKRFSRQGILRTHMNVHIGEKLLSCELCGKRFAQKGNLKTHMRLHSGEKPFACKLCGKDFVQQGHLTKHMRFHTGEKPFVCEFCGKRFINEGDMKKHMRVHTGERPFACKFCGKTFTQQEKMQKHMRVHT